MDEYLYAAVCEAYDNGLANGYLLDQMTPVDLAEDMVYLDADLERADPREVAKGIEKYRLERGVSV